MSEIHSDKREDPPREISVEEVHKLLEGADCEIRLVDIREDGELVIGYIDRAMLVPISILKMVIEDLLPDKDISTILYCASGIRSIRAAALMEVMGYTNVRSMTGGFNAWVETGYGIKTRGTMTMDQVNRYSRQMLLSEIGEEGQLKLLQSRVLIVGAGGLGSPVALYLAAAGVGTLGIYDFDVVDLSNIHRQPLHYSADVGKPKTESAKETLRQINPHISIAAHQERFTAENALKTIAAYDIVVDGSDNFATKFLLNDAAFFAKKPFVFGGAVRFDGQAGVFSPHEGGPCLRCMMPVIPPPGTSPSWSEVGVLGVVPGQIGLVQAAEVLKLILKIGKPLIGRFLVYDCLNADFRTFTITKNPTCPLCGDTPTITDLTGDYDTSCL